MTILLAECKFYKPKTRTRTAINGGVLSSDEYTSSLKNDVFGDISETERTSGITVHGKIFPKIDNAANEFAVAMNPFISDITTAGTRSYIFAATQTDTQGNITGSERKHGCGRLKTDATAGTSTLIIDVELGNGAEDLIQAGDLIRIADGAQIERILVDSVVTATDELTITTNTALTKTWLAVTPTVVSSMIENANVIATDGGVAVTSTAGTYDDTTYPLELKQTNTVEQTFTLTFTSPTAFNCSGSTLGSLGSGTTGADFNPQNPDFSDDYFLLRAAGFGGSFLAGDTLVFTTHPATAPFWWAYIVPAATAGGSDTAAVRYGVEG